MVRGGGFLVLCSTDSARGRFNDNAAADVGLTVEGVLMVGELAAMVVKGLSSEGEAVAPAGLMLIFVFASSTDEGATTGVGVETVEDCSMFPSSDLGFAGPDSFSIRRFRIYVTLS